MLREPKLVLDSDQIAIESLTIIASHEDLINRFVDGTGFEASQLWTQAARPEFFVGVWDFVLANRLTHGPARSISIASVKGEFIMDRNRQLEGAKAFNRGIERDRCPYAPGTQAFKDWVQGWKHQKDEFAMRLEHEGKALRLVRAS